MSMAHPLCLEDLHFFTVVLQMWQMPYALTSQLTILTVVQQPYTVQKYNKLELVFNFPKKLGRLPFNKYWGRLPFSKNWGRLPFSKNLRSSSIFKNIDVVFHISSSWVKIRLHTKNQLCGLPGSAKDVMGPGVVVWCGGFFTDYITTQEQNCFALF